MTDKYIGGKELLNVNGLSVKYHPSEAAYALKDVSFSAGSGERIAIAGSNGAGKSTLLMALCGVLTKTSGDITICGISMEKATMDKLRQKIGVVFQNPDDQLFMPTVYDDVAFGPRNYGTTENETEEKADAVLSALCITHLKNRLSHKLSGGEKRLASLAGVLIMEPELLLMDEPTTFLDPRAERRFLGILKELPQTMLMATHNLHMAKELCERVILLKEGEVFADGSSGEILKNTRLLEKCGL